MILPITAYGHQTLKKVGEDITKDYENLDTLIENMFETMYFSKGIGLAAQQINRAIRLFVIDPTPYSDDYPELKDFKKVFINARITNDEGEEVDFEEGCLSIPGINEKVKRKSVIYLSYYDEEFNFHENVRYLVLYSMSTTIMRVSYLLNVYQISRNYCSKVNYAISVPEMLM